MNNEKGVVLVISILLLLVITVLGLAMISTSTMETKMAGNRRGSINSLYSSDGTVQLLAGNSDNFLVSKFVNNKYDPFSDVDNQNPVKSNAGIEFLPDRECPRGLGFSSTQFEFESFTVTAIGFDQVDQSLKASNTVEETFVRLVPHAQD
jgi:hypothetical protein